MKKTNIRMAWHDYQALLYEEQDLKTTVSQAQKIPYSPRFLHTTLYADKFDPALLATCRLGLLSARSVMNTGGRPAVEAMDFMKRIEPTSESMSHNFLIDHIEQHLQNYNPDSYSQTIASTEEISTLAQFNQRNAAILQLDEFEILNRNLDFLTKARKQL